MQDQHALVAPLGAGGGQQARLADPARTLDDDHLPRSRAGAGEALPTTASSASRSIRSSGQATRRKPTGAATL